MPRTRQTPRGSGTGRSSRPALIWWTLAEARRRSAPEPRSLRREGTHLRPSAGFRGAGKALACVPAPASEASRLVAGAPHTSATAAPRTTWRGWRSAPLSHRSASEAEVRAQRASKPPQRSELEVVAQVAGLVDVHRAGVEPPLTVDAVEGVAVVPGDDDLQREL